MAEENYCWTYENSTISDALRWTCNSKLRMSCATNWSLIEGRRMLDELTDVSIEIELRVRDKTPN